MILIPVPLALNIRPISAARYVGVDSYSPTVNQLALSPRHTGYLRTLAAVLASHQLAPYLTPSLVPAVAVELDHILLEDEGRGGSEEFEVVGGGVEGEDSEMGRDCRPGHGDFELGIEVTSKVGTDALVCIDLDEPVFCEFTKVFVVVEQKIELDLLHYLGGLHSDQYLVWIQPLSSAVGIGVSQMQPLRSRRTLCLRVDHRHQNIYHLLPRLV